MHGGNTYGADARLRPAHDGGDGARKGIGRTRTDGGRAVSQPPVSGRFKTSGGVPARVGGDYARGWSSMSENARFIGRERRSFVTKIEQGLAQADVGETVPHAE